jgi:hypothetical protein
MNRPAGGFASDVFALAALFFAVANKQDLSEKDPAFQASSPKTLRPAFGLAFFYLRRYEGAATA